MDTELPKVRVERSRFADSEVGDHDEAGTVGEAPCRSRTLLKEDPCTLNLLWSDEDHQSFPYSTLSWSAPLNGSIDPSIGKAAMRSGLSERNVIKDFSPGPCTECLPHLNFDSLGYATN